MDCASRLTFDSYWTVPRINGLALSPDGTRLVMPVDVLAPEGSKFVTSLWEVPADGSASPRRITYSENGEGPFAFLPDGSLLFASAPPDINVKEDEADGRLFQLPAGVGEARPLLSAPGGIEALATARNAPVAVVRTPLFEDADGFEQDSAKAKRRKDAGASGILFQGFPIRYWDHELGPRHSRLMNLRLDRDDPEPLDLTSNAGVALHEANFTVSPDGETVVTNWLRHLGRTEVVIDLVAIRGAARRTLGTDADYGQSAFSPDGRWVVAVREQHARIDEPWDATLWLIDLESGQSHDLLPGFDLWPAAPVWSADGRAVWFTAADHGRVPVFRVDIESGAIETVAGEGAYSNLQPSRDGAYLYALRSSFTSPAEVVRIDVLTGEETVLPTPGLPMELPGRVEKVTARTADGVELHGWLVLPPDAAAGQPAPLLLWIHGGPIYSWSAWSWRWCPHLMAERGYAVLMPDPAMSIGYGREFIRRGLGRWGEPTFNDLETILDSVLERPDLDANRTAAMGASFGGYMANWLIGRTGRFRAIVSHSGIWSFETFVATTDIPHVFFREFGSLDERADVYQAVSPRSALDGIRTPVLVIHGLWDYRVPVSEALRLYADLQRADVPAWYLFFPDENHFILKPGNSRLWYETVLAFLDEHVRGVGWNRPELL